MPSGGVSGDVSAGEASRLMQRVPLVCRLKLTPALPTGGEVWSVTRGRSEPRRPRDTKPRSPLAPNAARPEPAKDLRHPGHPDLSASASGTTVSPGRSSIKCRASRSRGPSERVFKWSVRLRMTRPRWPRLRRRHSRSPPASRPPGGGPILVPPRRVTRARAAIEGLVLTSAEGVAGECYLAEGQ
jgi:hypothetical protein